MASADSCSDCAKIFSLASLTFFENTVFYAMIFYCALLKVINVIGCLIFEHVFKCIIYKDSPTERQKTERRMTEHRMTQHRMTEHRMTRHRKTEHRKK